MRIKFLVDYKNAKTGDIADFSDAIEAKGLIASNMAVEYKDEPQVITANVDSIAIGDAVCKGIEKLMGQKSTVVDKQEDLKVKTVGELTKKCLNTKTVNITTNSQGEYFATENNKDLVADLLKESMIVSKVPTVTLNANENLYKFTAVTSMGTAPVVTGESGNIGLSTQVVSQVEIALKKMTYMFKTTLEAERDLAQLIDVIMSEVPAVYANTLEKAMIVNSTLANVIGIVGHAQTAVAADLGTGQSAGTFVYQNAADMYVLAKNPQRCSWIMTPGAYAQVMNFNSGTNGQALFVGPNGAADAPFGRLLGQPIYLTQTSGIATGTVGDVILGDLSKYKFAVKSFEVATSKERYFELGEAAYRFVWTIAGAPIGFKLATGQADFVCVDTRSGS